MDSSGLSFAAALSLALSGGFFIRRRGWRTSFHLEPSDADATYTYLTRQQEKSDERGPWGVITEDDMFASDWEVILTHLEFKAEDLQRAQEIQEGSAAWAIDRLSNGLAISMGNLRIQPVEIAPFGKMLVLVIPLPNGENKFKFYRFSPADLHKEYGSAALADLPPIRLVREAVEVNTQAEAIA